MGKFDAFKFADDMVVRFQVNVHFCVNRCPQSNCLPGRSSVDIDSIEDNELGAAANERISLLKEEESAVDLTNNSNLNSTENQHVNDNNKMMMNRVDEVDALASNSRTKLLNKNEENNNRVRRDVLSRKEDRKSKKIKNSNSNNLLPDAALQREIIVEGLSSNEHDYQARSLYTRGKNLISLFLFFK